MAGEDILGAAVVFWFKTVLLLPQVFAFSFSFSVLLSFSRMVDASDNSPRDHVFLELFLKNASRRSDISSVGKGGGDA